MNTLGGKKISTVQYILIYVLVSKFNCALGAEITIRSHLVKHGLLHMYMHFWMNRRNVHVLGMYLFSGLSWPDVE